MTFISGANLIITALHQVTENPLISYCQEVLPMNKAMVSCINFPLTYPYYMSCFWIVEA